MDAAPRTIAVAYALSLCTEAPSMQEPGTLARGYGDWRLRTWRSVDLCGLRMSKPAMGSFETMDKIGILAVWTYTWADMRAGIAGSNVCLQRQSHGRP